MIHPGLEVHHPENQDDEALKSIVSLFGTIFLVCHPDHHPANHPGIILLQVGDSGSQLPPAGQNFEKSCPQLKQPPKQTETNKVHKGFGGG